MEKKLPPSVPGSPYSLAVDVSSLPPLPRTPVALIEEEKMKVAEPLPREPSPALPTPSEVSPTSSRSRTRNLLRRASSNRLFGGGKSTIEESPVEEEGYFSLSRKTSAAPSIASIEEARPTTPVSEEKEKEKL
jgi:hypothetical protein